MASRGTSKEEQRLRQELIEGYIATREEDAEINKIWEAATLERWG